MPLPWPRLPPQDVVLLSPTLVTRQRNEAAAEVAAAAACSSCPGGGGSGGDRDRLPLQPPHLREPRHAPLLLGKCQVHSQRSAAAARHPPLGQVPGTLTALCRSGTAPSSWASARYPHSSLPQRHGPLLLGKCQVHRSQPPPLLPCVSRLAPVVRRCRYRRRRYPYYCP